MENISIVFAEHWLNLAALSWFLICFRGYIFYVKHKSLTTPCLVSVMHMYRQEWMLRVMERENRIADTSAIANLERSVSFFASTTLLILAGLITVLGSADQAIDLVADIPFAVTATQQEWELKILLLIVLFIYAFFKFTWSLRQYGFASVMIGGAPAPDEQLSLLVKKATADRIAKMTSKAANNFNAGLRTYYFSLAVLGWFISSILFMGLSVLVVYILYRREFKSSSLNILMVSSEPERK